VRKLAERYDGRCLLYMGVYVHSVWYLRGLEKVRFQMKQ
jgi:hypothetical protein